MTGYNKVILIGNLTRDPELKNLPDSDTQVCNFSLAINRRWKDAAGETREEVCFLDCAAFGKTGAAIAQYLVKGSPIHIEGRLKLDRWEQDGQSRSKVRVIVEAFRFIGGNRAEATTSAQPGANSEKAKTPARGRRNGSKAKANRQPSLAGSSAGDGAPKDGDIPF